MCQALRRDKFVGFLFNNSMFFKENGPRILLTSNYFFICPSKADGVLPREPLFFFYLSSNQK